MKFKVVFLKINVLLIEDVLFYYIASLCISLPFLLYYEVVPINQSEVLDCTPQWPSMEQWSKGTTLGVVLTTFILPLTAIVICYGYILHHLWKGQKLKRSDGQDVSIRRMRLFVFYHLSFII